MDLRKWAADAIATPPTAPASPSIGYPTDGNPMAAQNATEPGAYWFYSLSEEMRNILLAFSVAPSEVNLTQLRDAIVKKGLQQLAASTLISAAGTVNAITAAYLPGIDALVHGMTLYVRHGGANTIVAPTFTPNSGVIPAKPIVKGNNLPLVVGDIAGAGFWSELKYDSTYDKWVLMNPAYGVFNSNAGISFTSIVEYVAGATLTSADVSKQHVIATDVDVTLTLPAANTFNGKTIAFANIASRASTATLTISAPAGQIWANGLAATPLVLYPGESIILQSDGTNYLTVSSNWRGGIKFNGHIPLTSNTTLNQSAFGRFVYVDSSSSVTVTLPAATDSPEGGCVTITNINSGIVIVARGGTDTIFGKGLRSVTSVSLNQGESITLETNGVNAWVQAFGSGSQGNMGGTVTLGTTTTLDGTHIGKVCGISSAGITVTLPTATSVPAGTRFMFVGGQGAGGAVSIVQRNSSDTILTDGTTALTSLSIGGGDTAELVAVSGTQWMLVSGTIQTRYGDNFPSIGSKQTWQNVTGSRALGTTYTNTTSKPILLTVNYSSTSGTATLSANINSGGNFPVATSGSISGSVNSGVVVVPAGATYTLSVSPGTPTLISWYELR